jgi:sulfur carrier protein ThiS adenylyltransferase
MSILTEGLLHYITREQLDKLHRAAVLIIGAGGLGSNAAFILVRSGIRRLILVDHDTVAPSNLNRQTYFPDDIGKQKVEALAKHLSALEPELKPECHSMRVTSRNVRDFFAKADIIVEAVDLAPVKVMLCEAAAAINKPFITASGITGLGRAYGNDMGVRRLGKRIFCVGDAQPDSGDTATPFAPRVIQAAAMQANLVLQHILEGE